MAGRPPNPNGRKNGRPTKPTAPENRRALRLPITWKGDFLKELGEHGHVGRACEKVGVSRSEVWHQRKGLLADPEFARLYDEAKLRATEIRIDMLEEELHRRSTEGIDEPVFYQGEECGKIRKYSDTLLQFALRSLKPEVFRDSLNINVEKLDAQIEKALEELLTPKEEQEHGTEAE